MAWKAWLLRLPVHGLAAIVVIGALSLKALAAQEQEVLVFAAASLKTALDEVNAAYQATSGADGQVLVRRQLRPGPADRAGRSGRPLHLRRPRLDGLSGRTQPHQGRDTRGNLLGNRIVLIGAPDAEPIAIEQGFDLAGRLDDGRLAMADTSAVPAGKYGKAALEALGAWVGVEGRLAQAENVRAALALVSTGEAPSGSSTRRMPPPILRSRCSAHSRNRATPRSSTPLPSRRSRRARALPPISPSSSRPAPPSCSASRASRCSIPPHDGCSEDFGVLHRQVGPDRVGPRCP